MKWPSLSKSRPSVEVLLRCSKASDIGGTVATNLLEQRRHQRIRFGNPPPIQIGYGGSIGEGVIVNLSLSGLMVRTSLELEIGHVAGCEFSLFGSPVIDVPVSVVSRVGDLFGARFQTGPINQIIIDDAISAALASGQASILSVNDLAGRKVMRISGGLNGALESDFMHALTRVGIHEMDLAGVTTVDQAGLALCRVATSLHGVTIGARSDAFSGVWNLALAVSGEVEGS
ncbi:PilZ domain-containing protein [Quatrionicoccus australiensis]|uniref:PilZ domain-containing protein n=1 Tax=Quatrionicoccus australiensis TaxID=138118 RepID=UPI001CF85871|nr:PilZ domain-containing protein [Quatrionicoccus australiensis]UCV15242.1 PilZ domain-containing protein [Quatrionicoccus australiensis]